MKASGKWRSNRVKSKRSPSRLTVARSRFMTPRNRVGSREAGDFKIQIGSSRGDIRLEDAFHLARTTVEK